MAAEIGIGIGTIPASDTTFDYISSELSGAADIVLAFLSTGKTDFSVEDDFRVSIGAADGTIQGGITVFDKDGDISDTDVERRMYDDGVLSGNQYQSLQDITHNSFITNGWRASCADADAATKISGAIMFGGSDVVRSEVKIVQLTGTQNVEQTVSFTDTSLAPNLIFAFHNRGNIINNTTADGYLNFGIATYLASTIKQRAVLRCSENNQSSANPSMYLSKTSVLGRIDGDGAAVDHLLELTDVSTGSIGLTPRDGSATSERVIIVALQLTNTDLELIDIDLPTSTGNHSQTGLSISPSSVIQINSLMTAYDTLKANDESGTFSISMFNNSDEVYSQAASLEDASNPTNAQGISAERAVVCPFDDGTMSAAANATNGFSSHASTGVAWITNGYTINYIGVNSTTRKGFALGMGDSGGAGGAKYPYKQRGGMDYGQLTGMN